MWKSALQWTIESIPSVYWLDLIGVYSRILAIEKFCYLITLLEGEPQQIVKSMSGGNYEISCSSLRKRYQNNRYLAIIYYLKLCNGTNTFYNNAKHLRQLFNSFLEDLYALDTVAFSIVPVNVELCFDFRLQRTFNEISTYNNCFSFWEFLTRLLKR